MNIVTKYNIGDRAVVDEVDLLVTIVGIRIEDVRVIYKVEYWMNGDVKVVDQWEEQLRDYIPRRERMSPLCDAK
jgi:hypothetical protein